MKKIVLIIIGVIVGVILLDTFQALFFDNNPIIKIKEYYNGGNYKLVDKTKRKLNFTCAEVLQSFYEDDNYTYYW